MTKNQGCKRETQLNWEKTLDKEEEEEEEEEEEGRVQNLDLAKQGENLE